MCLTGNHNGNYVWWCVFIAEASQRTYAFIQRKAGKERKWILCIVQYVFRDLSPAFIFLDMFASTFSFSRSEMQRHRQQCSTQGQNVNHPIPLLESKEYYYKLFHMLSQNIFVLPCISSLCFSSGKGHWQATILLIQHFRIPTFMQLCLVLYKGK